MVGPRIVPGPFTTPRWPHQANMTHSWVRRPGEGAVMPEAVIVATARSPIGRAKKGSLAEFRPDDLTARVVRSALDKVPQLNPAEIDDLMLGCGLPGGEQGFN